MNKVIFEINKLTPEKFDVNFLKKIGEKAVKILKLKKFREISIAVVCDRRIRGLNKKYRKKDRATDVLAFDYGLPFDGQGEIIICLPQAKRQAEELNYSLKDELAFLLIHGILHLAGYDDETTKNCNKMINKQKEVWQKVTSS